MAVVSTINSDWSTVTGKTLSVQSKLVSKMLETVICVAIGACAYPACNAGYTVDLSASGRITTIISAIPNDAEVGTNTLIISQYVPAAAGAAATGTLHFYESTANACNIPLAELPACATCAQCETVKFHVIGF